MIIINFDFSDLVTPTMLPQTLEARVLRRRHLTQITANRTSREAPQTHLSSNNNLLLAQQQERKQLQPKLILKTNMQKQNMKNESAERLGNSLKNRWTT
jgi:hypothetical protein